MLSQSRLEEGKEEREKLVLLLSANSVSQSGSVGCLWGWAGFLRHGDAPGRSRVLCQGVGKEKQLLPWVLSRTRGCAAHLIARSAGWFAGRHGERGCSKYNIGKDEKTSGWQ